LLNQAPPIPEPGCVNSNSEQVEQAAKQLQQTEQNSISSKENSSSPSSSYAISSSTTVLYITSPQSVQQQQQQQQQQNLHPQPSSLNHHQQHHQQSSNKEALALAEKQTAYSYNITAERLAAAAAVVSSQTAATLVEIPNFSEGLSSLMENNRMVFNFLYIMCNVSFVLFLYFS
jgi:hypothetical protein